jgi:hypothetical protein
VPSQVATAYQKGMLVFFYVVKKVGGDERDRTVDPLRARQVLSQLSYTPMFKVPFKTFFKQRLSSFEKTL